VGERPTDREWPARDAAVPRRRRTEGAIERLPIRPLNGINAAMNIGFAPRARDIDIVNMEKTERCSCLSVNGILHCCQRRLVVPV
jgi:hypothetical protein